MCFLICLSLWTLSALFSYLSGFSLYHLWVFYIWVMLFLPSFSHFLNLFHFEILDYSSYFVIFSLSLSLHVCVFIFPVYGNCLSIWFGQFPLFACICLGLHLDPFLFLTAKCDGLSCTFRSSFVRNGSGPGKLSQPHGCCQALKHTAFLGSHLQFPASSP